jgi:Plus-3 domain
LQEDALEEAAYEDIPGVTVRRHRLEDWVDKPFLDRMLPGCLVRLSLGERTSSSGTNSKVYMLAQVGLLAKAHGQLP